MQIQSWRRVFNVVEVVLELVQRVLGARAVGIIDLRPAGQTRFDKVPLVVERNFFGEFLNELRSNNFLKEENLLRLSPFAFVWAR